MRIIDVNDVQKIITKTILEINEIIDPTLKQYLLKAHEQEKEALAKVTLDTIIKNSDVAKNTHRPLCQDTGTVVVFCEIGHEVQFSSNLETAINLGVKKAYVDGFLRKSMVEDPLLRNNTKDNSPAIIHYKLVDGDGFKMKIATKGGGAENMSVVKMLKPADGKKGIEKLVLETIFEASGNPCPPLVVGIGIGGNLEKSALLAKEALFRDLDDQSPLVHIAEFEQELLEKINNLGVGPLGFGGKTTALAVKINTYPTHIASLPVAINLNCHSSREKEVSL